MPIERPRTDLKVVNPPKEIGNFFLDLPYRIYSSNRFDGNSDGAARDFEGLYQGFVARMGRKPGVQEWIAGSGIVGGRPATVALYYGERAGGTIIEEAVRIMFDEEPNKIYHFGDGAHIVTTDTSGAVLQREVKRDQEAKQLMEQLLGKRK